MIVLKPIEKEVLNTKGGLKFLLQRRRLISSVNGSRIPGLKCCQEKALASIPLAFLIVCLSTMGSIAFGALTEVPDIKPESLDRLDEEAWLKTGYKHLQEENYDEAIKAFTKCIEVGFSPYRARYGRGKAYYDLEEWDRAIADASHAIKLEPHLPLGYMLRASAYDAVGKYPKATADLTYAILMNPTDDKLYLARAIGFRHQGMPKRSLDDLDMALRLRGSPIKIYYQRGMAHTDLGLYEQAILDYSQALEEDPNDFDSLLARGSLYRCIGQSQAAIDDTSLLLSHQPTDIEAHVERGFALIQLDKYEQAKRDLEYALEQKYEEPSFFLSLAHVYFSQDQFAEAIEANQQAIDLDVEGKFPYSLFQRGIMLLHLGKGEDAEIAFQRGIALAKAKRAFQVIEDAIGDLKEFLVPESRLEPSNITMVKRVQRELIEMRAELGRPGESTPRVCVK